MFDLCSSSLARSEKKSNRSCCKHVFGEGIHIESSDCGLTVFASISYQERARVLISCARPGPQGAHELSLIGWWYLGKDHADPFSGSRVKSQQY